jgi:hypothetical protein
LGEELENDTRVATVAFGLKMYNPETKLVQVEERLIYKVTLNACVLTIRE